MEITTYNRKGSAALIRGFASFPCFIAGTEKSTFRIHCANFDYRLLFVILSQWKRSSLHALVLISFAERPTFVEKFCPLESFP